MIDRITDEIMIPEFSKFIRQPNDKTCKVIDETRLIVEILWGLKNNKEEFKDSDFSDKLILDWDYSMVLRYKKEKDNKTYIAWTLSFIYENNKVIVKQLQWSKYKNIWYKVNSSFYNVDFYLDILEKSFSKKWIYVELEDVPEWIDDSSISSKSEWNYNKLRSWIKSLNKKYKLENIEI